MRRYLALLGIFVSGQLLLLVLILFMPYIGSAADNMATATAGWAEHGWGWGWISNSTRLLILLMVELLTLFATGVAFLKSRSS